MPLQQFNRKALVVALAPVLAAAPMAAHAGGFALLESSASELGTSYAGAAASASDASTVYYNPAGLTYLPGSQITSSVDLIRPSAKFSDSGSKAAGGGVALGGSGGDAGSLAAVPALFISAQIAPRWTLGFGVNAPFGQKTNYTPDFMGRFQGLTSQITTINYNPSIAWRATDQLSLGLGVDYQHIDATFSQGVNYGGSLVSAGVPLAGVGLAIGNQREGSAVIKGSDYAWGWNAGLIYEITPQTKLGISYRSDVRYKIGGNVSFNGAPSPNPAVIGAGNAAAFNAAVSSGNVTANVKLPDTLSASLVHQLNDRWTLMGNVAWTGWSTIQNLTFVRDNGTVLSSTPENFRDTWRVGLGASYKANDQWLLRVGTAYDQTPVRDATVTPRLPDQSRYWLSVGAQYKVTKAAIVDVGYAHLFANSRSINQNNGNATIYGQLTGSYDVSVDILGAQLTYKF